MSAIARVTTKQSGYFYRLDCKNVLFFSLEDNYLILLNIYPYKKDITRSNIIESSFHKIKQSRRKNTSFSFLKNGFPVSIIT